MRSFAPIVLIALIGVIVLGNFLITYKQTAVRFVGEAGFFDRAPTIKKSGAKNFLLAKVYSTHPFNHRNSVALDIGSEDSGFNLNAAVTIDGQTLLGKITEINPNYSIAQTVFDSQWSSPVRIGAGEVNGLLIGGQEPIVTTIEKNHPVSIGDAVYSAGREFPYGLKIAAVKEIIDSPTTAFKYARLQFEYNFNALRDVWVLTD